MANFTIPVEIDPAVIKKLNAIEDAVKDLQEGIVELKKITLGTSLIADVDLSEVDVD